MDIQKQVLEEIKLLSNPENHEESLVCVTVLKNDSNQKSLTIEYNPNYISKNGFISYEWTKQELLDLIAKLD
jgi:hypothetical protein